MALGGGRRESVPIILFEILDQPIREARQEGTVIVRNIRISIAGLMAVVLVAAIGFAALRNSSEAWAGLMLMLTCGVLMLGVVGAVCRGPHERAWWLGFTLFGGGYLALAHCDGVLPRRRCRRSRWRNRSRQAWARNSLPRLATGAAAGIRSCRRIASSIACGRSRWPSWGASWPVCWSPARCPAGTDCGGTFRPAALDDSLEPAGPDRAGGILGRWPWPPRSARWPAPGIWAGVSFLLTCGLLGVAALGAAFSRGRDREAWLGAALFGFGYLALTFGSLNCSSSRRTCQPRE